MRHFSEGFHADRLLRRGFAPPAPGEEPQQFASTPLDPRLFGGLRCPGAERWHPARPILLVRLKAPS